MLISLNLMITIGSLTKPSQMLMTKSLKLTSNCYSFISTLMRLRDLSASSLSIALCRSVSFAIRLCTVNTLVPHHGKVEKLSFRVTSIFNPKSLMRFKYGQLLDRKRLCKREGRNRCATVLTIGLRTQPISRSFLKSSIATIMIGTPILTKSRANCGSSAIDLESSITRLKQRKV